MGRGGQQLLVPSPDGVLEAPCLRQGTVCRAAKLADHRRESAVPPVFCVSSVEELMGSGLKLGEIALHCFKEADRHCIGCLPTMDLFEALNRSTIFSFLEPDVRHLMACVNKEVVASGFVCDDEFVAGFRTYCKWLSRNELSKKGRGVVSAQHPWSGTGKPGSSDDNGCSLQLPKLNHATPLNLTGSSVSQATPSMGDPVKATTGGANGRSGPSDHNAQSKGSAGRPTDMRLRRVAVRDKRKDRKGRKEKSEANSNKVKLPSLSRKAIATVATEYVKTELEKTHDDLEAAIYRIYARRGDSLSAPQQLTMKSTGAKLVRSTSMQTYMTVFDGIAIGDDGTVQYEDFMRHLRDRAPALAEHAGSMYEVIKRENAKVQAGLDKKSSQASGVPFTALVAVLFPGASPLEIQGLLAMCQKRDDSVPTLSSMLSKLEEAYDLFQVLNKSGSGYLSRPEMAYVVKQGKTECTPADVEDLFGKVGTCFERGVVPLDVFFEWYSGVHVPMPEPDER